MNEVNYYFESSDSMAQFAVWLPLLFFGVPLMFIVFEFVTIFQFLCVSLLIILTVIGLRASIKVSSDQVSIEKKWFFVTYKRYDSTTLDDVWFGGDWGLPEGASCVVVKLGLKEITLGTSKNMKQLHDELWPLSVQYKMLRRVKG